MTTFLGVESSSTDVLTSSDSDEALNWPLHKISEPHESNDVLLTILEDAASEDQKISDTSDGTEEERCPIPWHPNSIKMKRGGGGGGAGGNQRFFELLSRFQEDYEGRSKIEKPLVTVQILHEWRNQSPPGRFLVVENNTNPPLWKDIGDKKARSKISKALKFLTRTNASFAGINSGSSQPQTDHQQSTTAAGDPDTASSSSPPAAAVVENIPGTEACPGIQSTSQVNDPTTRAREWSSEGELSDSLISKPHEYNDVLVSIPEIECIKAKEGPNHVSRREARDPPTQREHDPPIPWGSIQLRCGQGEDSLITIKGNQRFLELLGQHQKDYELGSKMEKPLVAVRVLQQWRRQDPPGRFLVARNDTDPPLWKDVGDKKARSKISKALKHLTNTQGTSASIVAGKSQPPNHQPALRSPAPTSASHPAPTTASLETRPISQAPQDMPSEVLVNEPMRAPLSRPTSDLTMGSSTSHGYPTSSILLPGQLREESKLSQEEDSPAMVSAVINSPAPVTHSPYLPPKVLHRPIKQTEEEEKKSGDPALAPDRCVPPSALKLPKLPGRFRKPERNVRRISEQLNSAAQEGGSIFGRWSERDQLTTIYQRQKRSQSVVDMVLISGKMGVGKTSLAQTLKSPLVDNDCGYASDGEEEEEEWPFFLSGKFKITRWSDPNEIFVSIVADFCHQLDQRNSSTLTRKYRNALVESLKDDILLLSALVPALDTLLKSPRSSTSTSTRASISYSMDGSNTSPTVQEQPQDDSFACMAGIRIKEVFGKFLRIIASVDPQKHAVIVLLDDLHLISEPAVNIVTSLATDRSNAGILFVGTYRDGGWQERHFENALLQWDHNCNVDVTKFPLENLREESVHLMLAEALSLREEETRSLNSLVFSLTKGNPTFITELLRVFQDKGLLQYDGTSQQWTCDIQQIPAMLGSIDGVPDLFKAKVLALPGVVQESLKIAACLYSTEIDISVLEMVDTIGTISQHLKFADMQGLLTFSTKKGKYAFVSDGVKEAIYDLIPVSERAAYHLKIGQRMWLHLDENESSSFYSLLMSQMFMGDERITEEEDRRAVAALCLRAGRLAAKYLGFQTAKLCLSHGISIVSKQKTWGRENYDLSLSLYNTAMEVCYCNGEFKELESLIEEVLENARTFEDSLLARSSQIYSLGSRNKQMEAIKLGLETLSQLGITFPSMNPSRWRVSRGYRRVRKLLRSMSDEDIIKLRRMKDRKKLAAMQIMNHFVLYTIYATPGLSALVAFKMVELTITSGLSAISSVGFALYGMILCRFDSIDDGYRYGKLSLKISSVFKKAVWLCRTYAGYYGTIHSRRKSIHEVIEPLQKAYRAGMQTGDIEYSMLNACLVVWNSSELVPLPALEITLNDLAGQIQFYGQTLHFIMLKPLRQACLNLMGKVPGDPKLLQGDLIDDDVEAAKTGDNPHFVIWIRFFQMKLAYLFGDYNLAEEYIDGGASEIYKNASGAMDCIYTMLYECMTMLALARRGKKKIRRIFHVRQCLKQMKFWAMHAPMNFLGKQFLLEAELAAVVGDRQKANSHYRSSILHSREAGFLLEEALSNEQLGRFYLESKENESAIPFLKAAREIYVKWGAHAKVEFFDEEFCELLD